jgi:hypothetical protein
VFNNRKRKKIDITDTIPDCHQHGVNGSSLNEGFVNEKDQVLTSTPSGNKTFTEQNILKVESKKYTTQDNTTFSNGK